MLRCIADILAGIDSNLESNRRSETWAKRSLIIGQVTHAVVGRHTGTAEAAMDCCQSSSKRSWNNSSLSSPRNTGTLVNWLVLPLPDPSAPLVSVAVATR